MKCSYCGNEVDNNFKFCPACGAKLEEDKVTSEKNISLIKAMVSAEAEKTETQPEQPAENKTVEVKPTENVVDSGFMPPKSGGFSIAGFVLALCSIFTSYLTFPCAVVGLVFSCIGLSRCAKGTGSKRGLAVAGMVISIIILSLMLINAVYFALSFRTFSMSSPFMNWA